MGRGGRERGERRACSGGSPGGDEETQSELEERGEDTSTRVLRRGEEEGGGKGEPEEGQEDEAERKGGTWARDSEFWDENAHRSAESYMTRDIGDFGIGDFALRGPVVPLLILNS
eukprot:2190873-Rhodomonas_salina.1